MSNLRKCDHNSVHIHSSEENLPGKEKKWLKFSLYHNNIQVEIRNKVEYFETNKVLPCSFMSNEKI